MAEQAKRGRPTKYSKELIGRARAMCRFGAVDEDLAEAFGVHVSQIHRWKKQHPEFAEALELSKPIANAHVERALIQNAVGWEHEAVKLFMHEGKVIEHRYIERFKPDTVAQIFFLKNRDPERWRDKQEVSLSLGAELEAWGTKSWQLNPNAPPPAAAEPAAQPAADPESSSA